MTNTMGTEKEEDREILLFFFFIKTCNCFLCFSSLSLSTTAIASSCDLFFFNLIQPSFFFLCCCASTLDIYSSMFSEGEKSCRYSREGGVAQVRGNSLIRPEPTTPAKENWNMLAVKQCQCWGGLDQYLPLNNMRREREIKVSN